MRKNMQKLGQPGGDFSGLVSIASYTLAILNESKQLLESLQKNMCTVRSEIFRRLMNCGGATNGLVQRDFDNHAAAAKSLSEIKTSFLDEGKAAVRDVLTFLEDPNNRPSRAFTADTSEFKFSRFPEVVNRMDELYAQEVDVIEADIVTEIERLIQVHFTLPYPAIQINFNLNSGMDYYPSGRDTVSISVQVTKIANDILHSILASLFIRLEEGLNRCFQDVLSKPNLWVENCIVARRCFREEAGRIEGVLGKIIDMVGGPSLTIQQVLQGVRGENYFQQWAQEPGFAEDEISSHHRNRLTEDEIYRNRLSEVDIISSHHRNRQNFAKGPKPSVRDRSRGGRGQRSQEGDCCWDVLTKLRNTIT